jgi:hypothetical protein
MKKLFSTILIAYLVSFFIVGGGWGATYYVNTSSGDDSAAGGSATPWKDVQFAAEKVAAGDTIYVTAPSTAPYNKLLLPPTAGSNTNTRVTISGTSPSNKAYFTSSYNVTQGNVIGNLLHNGSLDSWPVADTTLTGWTFNTTTGVTKLTGANCTDGSACLQITSSSYPTPQQWLYLPANTSITLSLAYKSNAANKPVNIGLNDTTNNKTYNGTDWSGTTPIATCTSSCSANWADASYTFNTNTTSKGVKYKLYIGQASSTGINGIDKVSLTYTNAVNWVSTGDGDGRTYSLSNVIPVGLITISNHGPFSKATTAVWASQGIEALTPIYAAADLATCKSTPNTWWFADEVLYYHLAEGEDITDLHLEFGRSTVSKAGVVKGEAISIDKDYTTLSNIAVIGGYAQGIKVAATGFIGNNLLIRNSGIYNFEAVSGTTTLYDFESSYGQNDGANCSGTAVCIFYRPYVHHNYDEGIEAYSGGHITAIYPVVPFNGQNGDGGSEGISCADASSEMTVYNGAVYGNAGCGIGVADSGILTVINTASYGNGFHDVRAAAGTTVTAHHNIYGSAYDQWNALGGEGAGTIVGNPLFVSSTDYHIRSGSPAINAGTDLCATLTTATDYAGNPVCTGGVYVGKGSAPEIGAYEFWPISGKTSIPTFLDFGGMDFIGGKRP